MLKPDVPVWWRFLEIWKHEIKTLYYDCLLGGPYLSPEEELDPIKKSWRHVNAKDLTRLRKLKKKFGSSRLLPTRAYVLSGN